MSAPSKPAGYTSLSPYLVVHGAQKVIEFLKQTFGATELRRYDNPDGTIMHAEVRVDDTVVMIADAAVLGRRFRPGCMSTSLTSMRLIGARWPPEASPCKSHRCEKAIPIEGVASKIARERGIHDSGSRQCLPAR
jgi:hypothetical protein